MIIIMLSLTSFHKGNTELNIKSPTNAILIISWESL